MCSITWWTAVNICVFCSLKSRNYRLDRYRDLATFFSYAVMEKLFFISLNGVPVSDQNASVVLCPGLSDQLRQRRHDNPVKSLQYACVNKLIIYVTMQERKAPINMLSRSNTPKTQIEGFTHMWTSSEPGWCAYSCENFALKVPLQSLQFLAQIC